MAVRSYDVVFIDELNISNVGENIRTLGIFEKYDSHTKRAVMSWKQSDNLHVHLDSVCLDMIPQHVYFILGEVMISENHCGVYMRARHIVSANGIDISLFQTSVIARRKMLS